MGDRTYGVALAWIATMAFLVAIVVVVLFVGSHEDHEFAWVEVARCEVADLTACDRPIGPAAQSFAKHYPDQPAPVRAVAYDKRYTNWLPKTTGGHSWKVELDLADGSQRLYTTTCGVGISTTCSAVPLE